MAFVPSPSSNSPYITHLPNYLNLRSPTISFDESLPKTCFQINLRIIALANYSCGRYQMIKQRLNEVARALLREFCAKDSLGDCQTTSAIGDNRDEIIRLQFRSDFRRPQEVPDKLTSVAKLLPMYFNKALPDTFASKSADLEFGTEHDPIMVSHQVGNGVPHFFQPLLA